jgi:hypothetical protein
MNIFAALAALLIVAGLVYAMVRYTMPEDITAERAAERHQNLADLRASEAEASSSYAWIDQTKGFVRLPLDRAVELTVQAGSNPTQARQELIERSKVANAVPAPPPEEPSEFE